jgi:hypothetical protein
MEFLRSRLYLIVKLIPGKGEWGKRKEQETE